MELNLVAGLVALVFAFILALFVWSYYRHKTAYSYDRYWTFWPRFWSFLVDPFVLWPISFSLFLLLSSDHGLPVALIAFLVIMKTLYPFVYTAMMLSRYGQTVGKMATHVRVVDYRTEAKISAKQAWIRTGVPMLTCSAVIYYDVSAVLAGTAPWKIDHSASIQTVLLLNALPVLWFVADLVTLLNNEKRRALHDYIAGTVVVRTNIEESGAGIEPASSAGDSPTSVSIPLS